MNIQAFREPFFYVFLCANRGVHRKGPLLTMLLSSKVSSNNWFTILEVTIIKVESYNRAVSDRTKNNKLHHSCEIRTLVTSLQ